MLYCIDLLRLHLCLNKHGLPNEKRRKQRRNKNGLSPEFMNELRFDFSTLISELDKENKAQEGEGDMSDLFKLQRAIIW